MLNSGIFQSLNILKDNLKGSQLTLEAQKSKDMDILIAFLSVS